MPSTDHPAKPRRQRPEPTQLDRDIARVGCFTDWQDFRTTMESGYVPTLRTDLAVAPTPELKAAHERVIAAALAEGFRIYAPADLADPEGGMRLQGKGHGRQPSAPRGQ